jgi:predicted RNase H-like nuclease (RuvC/YqgF family)
MENEEENKTEEEQQPEKPAFEKKLEEMKAENERMEKNIAELKELKAMKAMGGETEAAPVEKEEEDPAAYAEKVLKNNL